MDEATDTPETWMGGAFAPPKDQAPEEWMGGAFAPPKDDTQVQAEENQRLKQQSISDIFADEANKHTDTFLKEGKLTEPDIAGRLTKDAPWMSPEDRAAAVSKFEQRLPTLRKQAQFERSYKALEAERKVPEERAMGAGISPILPSTAIGAVKRYPAIGSLTGLATAGVKYQAAKRMEAGTDTEEDRRTIANMVLDQKEEQARNPTGFDKFLDTASYLPAFVTEWSMLGGVGGVSRKLATEAVAKGYSKAGTTFLEDAAAKAATGRALSVAERLALTSVGAPAEGLARTVARPDVLVKKTLEGTAPQVTPDEQGGYQITPGKPLTTEAANALRGQFIENAVFSAGGPFEAKAGEKFLPRVLKGWGQGVLSAEASQELQHLGAGAPQGSALHRFAFAKDDKERQDALTDFGAQVAAFGGIEFAMHTYGKAKDWAAGQKAKGKVPDPEKFKQQMEDVANLPGTKVFRGEGTTEGERVKPSPVQVVESNEPPPEAGPQPPAPPPIAEAPPAEAKPAEPQAAPPPTSGTPAPEPGTGIVNPVPMQPGAGIVSGAVEQPPETPRQTADRLEKAHNLIAANLDQYQRNLTKAEADQKMGLNKTEEIAFLKEKIKENRKRLGPTDRKPKPGTLRYDLEQARIAAAESEKAPPPAPEPVKPPEAKEGIEGGMADFMRKVNMKRDPAEIEAEKARARAIFEPAKPPEAPAKMPAAELYRRLEAKEPIPGLTDAQAHDLRERHLDENQSLEAIGMKRGIKQSSARESVRQSLEKAHQKLRDIVDNPEHLVRIQAPATEEDLHTAVEEMLHEEQPSAGKVVSRGELGFTKEEAATHKKPQAPLDPYEIGQKKLASLTKEWLKRDRYWDKQKAKGPLAPEQEETYSAEKRSFAERAAAIHSETLRASRPDASGEAAPAARGAPEPAAGRGGEPAGQAPEAAKIEGPEGTAPGAAAGHGAGPTGEPGAAGAEPAAKSRGRKPGPGGGLKEGATHAVVRTEFRRPATILFWGDKAAAEAEKMRLDNAPSRGNTAMHDVVNKEFADKQKYRDETLPAKPLPPAHPEELKRRPGEKDWNYQERKLKDDGALTLAQYVSERGKIKPSSLTDTIDDYKAKLSPKVLSEKNGEPIDTFVDGLVSAGIIREVPHGTDEATYLLDLLEQHHTIDPGKQTKEAQEQIAHAAGQQAEALAAKRARIAAFNKPSVEGRLTEDQANRILELADYKPDADADPEFKALIKKVDTGKGVGASELYSVLSRLSNGVDATFHTAGVDLPQKSPAAGDAAEPTGATAGPVGDIPGVPFRSEPIERAGFGAPLTEAERSKGMIAGGQEGTGAAERPKREHALANAKVDEQRAERGAPPLMEAARRSNPEVWDRAMATLDRDPEAGKKLVEELADGSKKSTTVDENALLLQRQIALANEHERAVRDYVREFAQNGRLSPALDELEANEGRLARQIDQLDEVARKTGTEWGRAGQFRKQLATERYELSGMLQRAAAAKGEPLTPEEKVQITQLHDRIKELEKKLEETEGKVRGGTAGAGELVKAKGQSEDAKGEFKKQLNESRKKREPVADKVSDWLKAIRVNFLISGIGTLIKVSAASASRLVSTPLEEASGAVLRRIPGLSKIAAAAPREGRGLNWKAEAKSFASFWTQGFVDAWRTVRTGKSELDSAHGKQGEPGGWLNLQFRLHDAIKAPAVRAEYTRSFLQRMDFYASRGEDISSPEALLRISTEAYVRSQEAKFRQQNWLVDSVNSALKIDPKGTMFQKVAKTGAKLLVPILRIPTNLVFETGTHIFGTATGSVQAINAYRKGIENLKPHEADAIMRQFKKGSLGLGMLLLGYFKPDMFGGYYQEDEKKKKGEPGFGEAQAGGVTIPTAFQHNPMMQVAQFGATIRKVQDKQAPGKLFGVKKGPVEGALAGVTGLGTEIPLIREATDVEKMVNAHSRGAAFGELAKSFLVPQLFQWLAGQMDLPEDQHVPFGHPNRRKPQDFGETLETGIPGLRQRVGLKQ